MSLRNVRWIFFDVGETLLDETASWADQFTRLSAALAVNGHATPVDDIWRTFRSACRDFAPGQWRAVCAAYAQSEQATLQLMTLGDGWRHDLQVPFPGARETLIDLSSRFKLGVIANQSLGTRERLAKHGMLDFISVVIGSAEAGVQKPDPRIFRAALEQADCAATDAAMVGDRIDNDVRPAKLLGMTTVHVRQGGSGAQRARDESEIATCTVETIGEVGRLFPVACHGTPGER